jgi:hypothetical protein
MCFHRICRNQLLLERIAHNPSCDIIRKTKGGQCRPLFPSLLLLRIFYHPAAKAYIAIVLHLTSAGIVCAALAHPINKPAIAQTFWAFNLIHQTAPSMRIGCNHL